MTGGETPTRRCNVVGYLITKKILIKERTETMPRTPKNPDTYINRNGMITRTVTTTKVKVEFVKLKEKQFGEEFVTVRKPGKSAVVEARKKFNDSHKNEDIQIVNIEAVESKSELVGMTEDEFIERGTILKPASDYIKELESEEQ